MSIFSYREWKRTDEAKEWERDPILNACLNLNLFEDDKRNLLTEVVAGCCGIDTYGLSSGLKFYRETSQVDQCVELAKLVFKQLTHYMSGKLLSRVLMLSDEEQAFVVDCWGIEYKMLMAESSINSPITYKCASRCIVCNLEKVWNKNQPSGIEMKSHVTLQFQPNWYLVCHRQCRWK